VFIASPRCPALPGYLPHPPRRSPPSPAPLPPSPPMSMVQMEKIFSASVLAQTLPKPTLVRLLRVK